LKEVCKEFLSFSYYKFSFFVDGYDNFETADDFLSSKPTPRTRQLQKARRTLSKTSYDDLSVTKKEFLNNSNYDIKEQYDDYLEDDQEYETGDTYVEHIDDDDNIIDDDSNLIFKYRSSTQKST